MLRTLRSFLGLGGKKPVRPQAGKFFRNMRLNLEALEDRSVPASQIGSLGVSPLNINAGGNTDFDINRATPPGQEGNSSTGWDLFKVVNGPNGSYNFSATPAQQFTIFLRTRAAD